MGKTYFKYRLLALLLLTHLTGYAQKVELFLMDDSIMIGEQTTLKLRITYPYQSEIEVTWPDVEGRFSEGQQPIEYISDSGVDSLEINNGGRVSVLRRTYIITSFDSGYYAIKPFELVVNQDTVFTMQKNLYVNTISDVEELYDIKDIHTRPFNWIRMIKKWLPILLLVGLLFWIARYFMQRQSIPKSEPIPIEPIVHRDPAHVIAYTSLQALKEKDLLMRGQEKQYQSELTAILRTYIEDRYHIQAMEQTTAETLRNLSSNNISAKATQNLTGVLNMADLVKFAKGHLSQQLNAGAWDKVKDFVDETMINPSVEKKIGE